MLTFSISRKRMEPVARWNSKVVKACGQINILEFPGGPLRHVRRDALALTGGVQLLSATVCERLDHLAIVTRHVTRGKQPCSPHNAQVNWQQRAQHVDVQLNAELGW
jgi:hypothetical protein